MTSLRTRIIFGSALVATLPLALALFLFSRQVGAMVRSRPAERLTAALAGLEAQLHLDSDRVAERLQILGRDPTLKRLYLVREGSSRELAEFVEERRRLLGLDFLDLTDDHGRTVVEAAATESSSVAAMSASAPILYEGAKVGAVSGGVRLDLPYLQRLKRTTGVELTLLDGERPVTSTLGPVPQDVAVRAVRNGRAAIGGRSYLARILEPRLPGSPGTRVLALVSTAAADATLASLGFAALGIGVVGLVLAVLFALLWSSLVSRPVENLAAFSRQLAGGRWEEPLTLHGVRELETLGEALDSMRRDLQSYRSRLIVSERHAAWSQMARQLAHEIKNPLTPIAISVTDLRRSYEARRPDFPEILDQAARIVEEEVDRLKHLLEEFSDFGRLPAPRFAACELRDLFGRLEALHPREVAEGRLQFVKPMPELEWSADEDQLRQALINLIKNGLEAGGRVSVSAAVRGCGLEITVADDGPGLTPEQMANLFVPGFTTKATGSGLGLTITEKIVSDHGGTIVAEPLTPRGTAFHIRLPIEPRT